MQNTTKQGYIGIDKAGSVSHFPIVIASVYSKEYKTFLDAMKEVRKIAVKEKNIFLNKREIKSRDIKNNKIQKEIVEVITDKLNFFAVIINNNFYGDIRALVIKKKGYMEKLEALFWYKSISLFCSENKIIPKKVYLDFNYTNDKDLRLFEENIALLFDKFHAIVPLVSSHDSKEHEGIALSDLLSGFLMRNRTLVNQYKSKVKILTRGDVENELKFLFKL